MSLWPEEAGVCVITPWSHLAGSRWWDGCLPGAAEHLPVPGGGAPSCAARHCATSTFYHCPGMAALVELAGWEPGGTGLAAASPDAAGFAIVRRPTRGDTVVWHTSGWRNRQTR